MTDTIEGAGVGGNMDVPAVGLIDDMESTIKFLTLCQGAFSVMDPTEAVDIVVKGRYRAWTREPAQQGSSGSAFMSAEL